MKEKYWPIINYVLMLGTFLVGFFLANGTWVFSTNYNGEFTLWQIILVGSVFALLFGALLAINIVRKKYQPNYALIGILGGLFIINLITVLVFKSNQTISFTGADGGTYSFDFALTAYDKACYIVDFFAVMAMTLFIFDISWQVSNGKKLLTVLSLGVIAMDIVFIICSYFMHGYNFIDFYRFFLSSDFYRASVISVFATKNAYACTLFIGLISCIYLHMNYRKWYWLAIGGYIYTNIIHTISKSVIILGGLLILAYLLYIFFTTYKQHKKMNLIALVSIGGTILLIVLAGIVLVSVKGKWAELFETIYIQKGQDTLESRTWIWQKVIDILDKNNWIVGVGYMVFTQLIHGYNLADTSTGSANNRYSAHSGYLQFLGEGGIIALLVMLFFVGCLIYYAVKSYKKNPTTIIFSLTILAIFLVYMSIESAMVIMPHTLEYAIAGMFIAVPILAINKDRYEIEKQQ